jgi:hypothetical protein
MALTFENFDINNVTFDEPKTIKFKDVSFQRIPIKYFDGKTKTKLAIQTPALMSWGIQDPSKNKEGGESTGSSGGYSMSLVMFSNESGCPNEEERKTMEMFDAILEKSKAHLKKLSTQKALGKFEMDGMVDCMKIFYRKRDKETGKIMDNMAPTMYPKLLMKYSTNKSLPPAIDTKFYDIDDEEVVAETLIGTRCMVQAAVVVDNLYIGAKPSIQMKINDANVMQIIASKRLLAPVKSTSSAQYVEKVFDDDTDEDGANEDGAKPLLQRRKS